MMQKKEYPTVNETVYSYQHSSGLRIYIVEKPEFQKSCAYFATHFGSIDNHFVPLQEEQYIQVPDGVAHFLEHKMFEQPDGENVFDTFSKYGASANAFTSSDITAYYFWCTNSFEENLKTLLHYVQTPYFTEENVAKEQGIIGQEIRMYDDDPNWRAFFNMLGCLYHNHPVKVDIAGTVESIAEITKDTLYTCYNTFYHPSNMALCIVSNVSAEKVKETIDKTLKEIKAAKPVARKYPEEPKTIHKPYQEAALSVAKPLFYIGFKDSMLYEGKELLKHKLCCKIALDLLLGKSSDLYNTLYEQGLISSSFSYAYTGGLEFAYTEIAGESDDPKQVAKRVQETLSGFCFSDEALERAKRMRIGRFLRVLDDAEEYTNMFARNILQNIDMLESIQVYQDITCTDIEAIFQTHLTAENMVLSVVNPL